MFAQTAKGFHIHPPRVPEGVSPNDWWKRLFLEEADNFALRPYEEEQWGRDVFLCRATPK
jgi:hypothetical protein